MRKSAKQAQAPSAAVPETRAADGLRPRRMKRRFSAEFKLDAVRLVRRRRAENVPAAQVARELGITPGVLSEWIRQFGTVREATAEPAGTGETLQDEVRRLRREVTILKEERAFAKKAAAFFAKESL
jgi:transposase